MTGMMILMMFQEFFYVILENIYSYVISLYLRIVNQYM